MDPMIYLGIMIVLTGVALLIALLRQDRRERRNARDDFAANRMLLLDMFVRKAVYAVEQMVRIGTMPKDNTARKNTALRLISDYGAANGRKLTAEELAAAATMIEAEVYWLHEDPPPDPMPPGCTYGMDGIDLDTMSYEALVLFALDNGFGVPEDGELHGQNKEEIRQSMLEWLDQRLRSGAKTGQEAQPAT